MGLNEQSHVDTPTETIDLVDSESKSPVVLTPPVPKDTNGLLPLARPSNASGAQVLSPISGTVMEKVAQKSTRGHALTFTYGERSCIRSSVEDATLQRGPD